MAEAQNFSISFTNFTTQTFPKATTSLSWGKIVTNDSVYSRKKNQVAFKTSGASNASAGTEGSATWTSADGKMSFSMSWDIPWGAGSSSGKITSQVGCIVTPTSWKGDAIIRQTLAIAINEEMI